MSLPTQLRTHLAALGRKGGQAKTAAKRRAAQKNLVKARQAYRRQILVDKHKAAC